MKPAMSLLVLGLGLLNNFTGNSSAEYSQSVIPSRSEQANLLLNVQEVFEQVKLLTKDEANSTNISVSEDIELMAKRAEYTLDLLQQITQLRLSCDGNSVCSLDARPVIKQLTKDAKAALRNCTQNAINDILGSCHRLANVTSTAVDRAQVLLDDLGDCSKKAGLGVISCYKNIIATDVIPVKNVLLSAVEGHRIAHSIAVDIRRMANLCVDDTIGRFKILFEEALLNALKCNE